MNIYPLFFLPGGLRPPDPPLGRADGRRTAGEPSLSTSVFFSFWGPLFRHCFLSAFLKVYRPWEVSHLFSRQISRRMHSESCLGTPWGSRYEHICKNWKKQCRKSATPKKLKTKGRQSGFIYSYIPPYTFIYLQIALYTLTYPTFSKY